jgi:amidophosphoribosyltransferase
LAAEGGIYLIHEECGIFGVFDRSENNAARSVYFGLFALQHRGQESCGIAANDKGVVRLHKDMGLVPEVFTADRIDELPGNIAMGHVRYSTTGQSVRENAQPLVTRYSKGTLALAHNGNLKNTSELRSHLEDQGAIFQTTIDSEIIAYLIARERSKRGSVEEAIVAAMPYLNGAYSLLVMSPKKLIAVRDPLGYRPLCIGRLNDATVFASESCALDTIGAEFVRDVEPGEVVIAEESGIRSIRTHCKGIRRLCIFEYIYFARSDSRIDGQNVFDARVLAGGHLARQYPVEADLVIGVPDSGMDAAMGYAMESGIPLGRGFVKNNYVGRTFIRPEQSQRETAVRIKLNPIRSCVEGKRVIMVDDSIVRGTTSARIVHMLKSAGATEVHVRISAPPFLWPCYYGTDIPSRDELTAQKHTIEQIRALIGADSLGYLQIESLSHLTGHPDTKKYPEYGFCSACFSGDYPEPEILLPGFLKSFL